MQKKTFQVELWCIAYFIIALNIVIEVIYE